MKKTIYNIFSLCALASTLFIGTACEEENTPVDNTPRFPELVTDNDVEPGTELTLTIQPNMAWSISIPKESYEWFKIMDGKFKVQTLSGISAGEPVVINIWTTDEESFALRSCDVKMTMAGETKTIASYTLRAKAKTVEAYKVALSGDGSFSATEDGYVYEETAMSADDQVELVWDENDKRFYFPVKIKANYDWTVEWPSWARADINVDSKVGDTCFEIYGISSKLPMEDTVGEVSFKNGEEVLKTFKIKIPGCKDIFTYTLGGFMSLTFDHAEYFHSGEGSYSKDPVQGIMYGPAESRIVVLEKTADGYVAPQNSWLNVELTAWDAVDGADVLQTRTFSISAPRYAEGVDREAMLLFLPATAPENVDDLLSGDRKSVKEEFASYAVPVVQTRCPDEYFTFEAEEAERVEVGLIFEKSESGLLPDKNFSYAEGTEDWQYNLSYVKDMAVAKSPFYITYPYETVSIYDAAGNEVTKDLSEHWLSYNPLGEGLYGQILMDMTKFISEKPTEIDGYVVFKDEQGKVLAAVHCFYKAEVVTEDDVLEDASAEMFADPSAAAAAGATIHKVVSGPTYEKYKEQQAPIYILTYTKDNTTLKVNTSKKCQLYTCVGMPNGPKMVTIDNQIFSDHEFAAMVEQYLAEGRGKEINWDDDRSTMGYLRYGATSQTTRTYQGVSDFNMTMPEPAEGEQKAVSHEEVIQFATTDAIQFIFICKLDLTSSAAL